MRLSDFKNDDVFTIHVPRGRVDACERRCGSSNGKQALNQVVC